MPLRFKMRADVTPTARSGYKEDEEAIYQTLNFANRRLERIVGRNRYDFDMEYKILPSTGDDIPMILTWTERT
jgi:hypothetical protein